MSTADPQSLYSALKEKYCQDDDDIPSVPAYIRVPKIGGYPLQRRKSVVINQKGITYIGNTEKLRELCPAVEEAHIGWNNLSKWNDVLDILHSMPKLSFLDLISNPLKSESFAVDGETFPNLTVLALNSTKIEWSALWICLKSVSNLTQLHIAHNSHSTIEVTPGFMYPSLKQLNIQENQIKDWNELAKLSNVFVNLQILIASGNPLVSISLKSSEVFPELVQLSLNSTLLNDWDSFVSLAPLAKLQELNVLRTPICEGLKDEIRRFAIIARMPTLCKLNKSEVTPTEREDSERWFLRQFNQSSERPAVYDYYVQKHGALQQLVSVDLTPKNQVRLEFIFMNLHERQAEWHEVSLKQTVKQLKSWVAKELLGTSMRSVRLCIQYSGTFEEAWQDSDDMVLDQRHLYAFKHLKDGDQIHVCLC